MEQSGSRLAQGFANRFEADGDSYIFRANLRAPGIRVSTAERDGFVVDYRRNSRRLQWGGGALMLIVIGGAILLAVLNDIDLGGAATYLLIAFCVAPFVFVSSWLVNAPVRALRGRATVDQGRTQLEASRVGLRRLTWGQLGGGILILALALYRLSLRENLLVGWNRLWLVGAAPVLLIVGRQAVRKLMAGRDYG